MKFGGSLSSTTREAEKRDPGSRLAKDHLPNRTSFCLFVLALVAFVFSFVAAIEAGEFLLGPPFWKRGSSHCPFSSPEPWISLSQEKSSGVEIAHCPASVFAGANCACVYHVSYATLIVNFADWKPKNLLNIDRKHKWRSRNYSSVFVLIMVMVFVVIMYPVTLNQFDCCVCRIKRGIEKN